MSENGGTAKTHSSSSSGTGTPRGQDSGNVSPSQDGTSNIGGSSEKTRAQGKPDSVES